MLFQRIKNLTKINFKLNRSFYTKSQHTYNYQRFHIKQPNNNKRYDLEYQKAYLASSILKMIMRQPKQNINYSLREQIILFIQQQEFDQDSKNKVKRLFTQGIKLNAMTYNQIRFQQAVSGNQNVKQLTIFNPIRFIIRQMQDIILDQPNKMLVKGHYGVSKSFSIVLLQKLSDFIVEYKFSRVSSQEIGKQIIDFPKILYWSIQTQEDTIDSIEKRLLSQMSDIERKQTEEKLLDDNCHRLVQIYRQKELTVTIIIDQIDNFMSYVKLNNFDRKMKNLQTLSPMLQKITRINQILRRKFRYITSIIYLSPITIERCLLEKVDLFAQKDHTNNLDSQDIQFSYLLNSNNNKMEIIDYFLFQLRNNVRIQDSEILKVLKVNGIEIFSNKIEDLKTFNNLKKQLFSEVVSSQKSFYLTPLSIREYFKLKKNKQRIRQKIKQLKYQKNIQILDQGIEILVNQLKGAQKYTIVESLSLNVQQFMLNNSKHKILKQLFIVDVFTQLIKKSTKSGQNRKQLRINLKDKNKLLGINNIQILQQILDNHLFQITDDGFVKCLIPPELILNIKLRDLNQTLINYAIQQLTKIKIDMLGGYIKSTLGHVAEQFIKLLILKANITMKIMDQDKECLQFLNVSQQHSYFTILSRTYLDLNKQQQYCKSMDFIQTLRSGFQQIIKESQKIILQNPKTSDYLVFNKVFLPERNQKLNVSNALKHKQKINKNKQQQSQSQISQNRKTIDFIIARLQITLTTKSFIIYAFNPTISLNENKYTSKFQKFMKSYSKLIDKQKKSIFINNQEYKIQLIYYVITQNLNQIAEKKLLKNIKSILKQLPQPQAYQHQQVIADYVILKFKNKNLLLKQIGCLYLNKNIRFFNNTQQIDVKLFYNLVNNLLKQKRSSKVNISQDNQNKYK